MPTAHSPLFVIENYDEGSSDSKRSTEKLILNGKHHWSDDYRTYERTIICSECGDIHHGEGLHHCKIVEKTL